MVKPKTALMSTSFFLMPVILCFCVDKKYLFCEILLQVDKASVSGQAALSLLYEEVQQPTD